MTYDTPPATLEVSDNFENLDNLIEAKIYVDIIEVSQDYKQTMFYDLLKNLFSCQYYALTHRGIINLIWITLVQKR